MTALSDHIATVKDWLNDESYSDALVTSWVRMFEETASSILRVKHMLQIDTATINANRVLLPTDWLSVDLLRVVGGPVLKFRTREDFYEVHDDTNNYNSGYYTISGNYLILGGQQSDGDLVELHYMQDIPPLGDLPNWLMQKYSTLYVLGTLVAASLYGIEDERAGSFKSQVEQMMDTLNNDYKMAKFPQSSIVPKRAKGFG